MKGERLFRILGHVDNDLIGAAEDNKPEHKAINKVWMKWTAVAACALFIIGGGILWRLNNGSILPPGSGNGGSGHAEGSTFMRYAGPILPLNVSGDAEGITSSRSIHFDFEADKNGQRDLWVTDNYNLTNNTDKDKTIEISYPFISSMIESEKYTPILTVNGEKPQTELIMGDYAGDFTGVSGKNGSDNTTYNLAHIRSWEGYKSLLEDGRYFKIAQSKKTLTDQSVTVYTFHDTTYPEEYDAATLAIEFDLPQGSKVITYGMNGASFETETYHHQYDYFVSRNSGQRIIILGEPPAEYTVQGYENGACERSVDGITGTVKEKNMLLSEVIKECMKDHKMRYGDLDNISPLVTEELAYGAVVSMLEYTVLGSAPKDRYDWIGLDDLIGESYSMERVMYLTAQITIPPGQSIELESQFIKGASYDFACAGPESNRGVKGYDMMTKLGSSLEFSEQKAGINLPQTYEIIRQNFGFDPAKGITEVSLDMSQERYYLEIRAKSAKDM